MMLPFVTSCARNIPPNSSFCQNFQPIILSEHDVDVISSKAAIAILKNDEAYEYLCIEKK